MEAVHAEQVDPGVTFQHWNVELHKPDLLIWSDRRRVLAVLEDRRSDGWVICTVADPRMLADIADGGRLAMVFRADWPQVRKGTRVPLFTTDYSVDRSRGVVLARFVDSQLEAGDYLLPEPLTASLRSSVLFQRVQRVSVVRLSPYHGAFVTQDPGRCLVPGMVVTVESWLPWLGRLRLRAQLTAYREEPGGVRFAFRIVDRRSRQFCAIALAGTVEGFDFAALASCGVKPSRMTGYLTVQTVSDDATFRQALGMRLAGNRSFGRLSEVTDCTEVADHLDPHSVNFMCLLGNKVLGTGRVVVNAGDRALSEIEAETTGLPVHIWRGGFVEVSRLAIHPDARGAGVVVALFREVARMVFNLDCRYLVLDSIEKLAPSYEKIGAKRLPLTKTHPYSAEPVQVMAIDLCEQLGRVDRRWLYWQYVFGPPLKHHAATSSLQRLTRFVRGSGRLVFWIKRRLGRLP
ncbi:GNAT family N-acetyltransferase [Salinactinospora qingdaonensis]|uniref:N-acetyltransferase domain-containing protein n=1 Tax=Salinactinospora qingdaonensis TaxID=702744 RepID=A0ABP7G7H1_9ACTN